MIFAEISKSPSSSLRFPNRSSGIVKVTMDELERSAARESTRKECRTLTMSPLKGISPSKGLNGFPLLLHLLAAA